MAHVYRTYTERLKDASQEVARDIANEAREQLCRSAEAFTDSFDVVEWGYAHVLDDIYERAYEASVCCLVIPRQAC